MKINKIKNVNTKVNASNEQHKSYSVHGISVTSDNLDFKEDFLLTTG